MTLPSGPRPQEHAPTEGETPGSGNAGTGDPARTSGSSAVEKLDLNALRDAITPLVNQAITSQLRRTLPELLAQHLPKPSAPAEPAADNGQPQSAKAQLEAMQRRLEQVERERKDERDAAAQQRRDLTVRQAIERVGAFNTEAAFRQIKPDLKVSDDGNYYAQGPNGEFLSVEEHVRSVISGNRWLQPATGRGGGGGTGAATGAAPATTMTKDQYLAKLDEFIAKRDDAGMAAFQAKMLRDEVKVSGVNAI